MLLPLYVVTLLTKLALILVRKESVWVKESISFCSCEKRKQNLKILLVFSKSICISLSTLEVLKQNWASIFFTNQIYDLWFVFYVLVKSIQVLQNSYLSLIPNAFVSSFLFSKTFVKLYDNNWLLWNVIGDFSLL